MINSNRILPIGSESSAGLDQDKGEGGSWGAGVEGKGCLDTLADC